MQIHHPAEFVVSWVVVVCRERIYFGDSERVRVEATTRLRGKLEGRGSIRLRFYSSRSLDLRSAAWKLSPAEPGLP